MASKIQILVVGFELADNRSLIWTKPSNIGRKARGVTANLTATSSHEAPWFVVPTDDTACSFDCSQIILDAINELKMTYPKTTAKRRLELRPSRKQLCRQ